MRNNIGTMEKSLPYALDTFPFMVTAKSQSINEEEPIEIKFKAEGIYNVRDDTPLLMFDESTCQVVVGLKHSCCILTTVENGTHKDNLTICTESKSPEHCQMYALVLAKKLAIDCSRFKDKNNDISSITEVNNQLVAELMSKRSSIQELDGNREEAFSKTPADSRLPIQLISREQADLTPTDEGHDDDEEEAEKTDLSKGIFIAKAFGAELGVDGAKEKVDVKLDTSEIMIGDDIAEKFDNMVWPCRDQRDLCNPTEFWQTKGFEKDKLDAWKQQ